MTKSNRIGALASCIALASAMAACRAEMTTGSSSHTQTLGRGTTVTNVHSEFALLESPQLNLPPRADAAVTGSEFLARTQHLAPDQREDAIYREIVGGNIPDFMRHMRPVQLADPSHPVTVATIWVLPDYLAIGSNDDYVRIPMNLITATRIAHDLGLVLPTTKIVDAVYAQAKVRATPHPLPPLAAMTSNAYYQRHNTLINEALGAYPLGELVAGHKKDVVISNKLYDKPGRITIYGWHQHNGAPIQPLSDAHETQYADYSHGIRLVSDTVWINGTETTLTQAVADPGTAALFSDEGVIERYGQLPAGRALAQSAP